MNKIILETQRVYLTEASSEDGSLILDLDSDPEVMKYLTDGRPSTLEEIDATLERIKLLRKKHKEKFGVWLAFEKSSDEFMGWFLFRPGKNSPDDLMNIELGYRLKKKFWGQGFASEVSNELVQRGFSLYKLKSIFAITMKQNLGSQAVMKKVGMKWVNDYIEDQFPGEDKSAVKFEITLEEWYRSAKSALE